MIKKYAVLLGIAFSSFVSMRPAFAMSIDWTGGYRFEYVEVDRTSLASPTMRKSYLLNHLHLNPKIIASDGVNIIARFDVLQNPYYPDSQVGQSFGAGSNRNASGASSTTADSSVAGGNQKTSYLQVSQLYANINQEYGQIVVGRAPVHFGLGISYSAGNGPFDHWSDNRDMIGYKFIIGNLSFMPIIDRVYDYSVAQGRDVQDVIWNIEYNNVETESIFGLWHQTRNSSIASNDAPAVAYGGAGATIAGAWNTQDVNIYLARGFESLKFRIEAAFRSGTTGVQKTNGEEVKINGYGIALETDFISEGKTQWQLRAGLASGDNPETTNYEGFHFNRNYDVAFLLFNHPLGKYDLLRTYAQRNADTRSCVATAAAPCAPGPNDEVLDEETVSNTYYISPKFKYAMSDKWEWNGSLTFAQLQTNPDVSSNTIAKDIGFEIDTGLIFKPTEKIQWINEVGLLFPGGAFKGGTNNFDAGFTYGFQSKAAISF